MFKPVKNTVIGRYKWLLRNCSDDNAIELFLEMLDEGDIVLGVAHDEASNK